MVLIASCHTFLIPEASQPSSNQRHGRAKVLGPHWFEIQKSHSYKILYSYQSELKVNEVYIVDIILLLQVIS